ncbi:hypothetical protein [Polyangium sp. 6x1]|uniref:radical SAM protein n=1 Tax=Polyangium sp. 6x1 TaxID=3042689 RepID=UPI002482568F|nr:hypothetical protein [Polyangium sp. 6x1]MDI1450910.1 hypothetical protein [Polyangium sp. 6x1]
MLDVPRFPPPEATLRAFAPPGWEVARVGANERGDVALYLARSGPVASFRLRLSARRSIARPSLASPVGDVRIDQPGGLSLEAAHAVAALSLGRAHAFLLPLLALFPHLLLGPEEGDGEALRGRLSRVLAARPPWLGEAFRAVAAAEDDLFLDPPGIAAWLAPNVRVGGEAVADHVLASIELPPNPRRTSLDLRACVLTFAHVEDRRSLRVRFGARDAVSPPFAVAGEVAVGLHEYEHRGVEDDVPVAAASLCAWLAALVALKRAGARKVRVPRRVHEVRALVVPAPAAGSSAPASADIDAAGTLHLHIDAECGQACVFCPIKAVVPAQDEGEAELEGLRLRMRAARERGATGVQLNGLDPLAFSRILDLVESVAEHGFERLTLMGPARRLADADFRRALFSRAPEGTRVVVPIYGVTAEVHDAVTGRPGSHAEVLAALDGLLADGRSAHVALATVTTRHNMHEWTALVAFANARGLSLFSQPVYPLRAAADAAYRAAALPETAIVTEVVRTLGVLPPDRRPEALASLASVVRHPCVRFHAERLGSEPLPSAGAAEPARALAAVIRRESGPSEAEGALGAATVPCAEAARCALAASCPREHYTAYVELFGTSEFVPVTIASG